MCAGALGSAEKGSCWWADFRGFMATDGPGGTPIVVWFLDSRPKLDMFGVVDHQRSRKGLGCWCYKWDQHCIQRWVVGKNPVGSLTMISGCFWAAWRLNAEIDW